jgi:cobalamin-dependent methionine synthase I
MAATIGNELSLETERLMKEKKMTEALLMDAFGSEAVEEVVNTLCRLLQEAEAFKDQAMTRRFSPGYGDWRLEAQEAIVKELAVDRIGITLSRHFALVPEKSITAIVGWSKE